MSKTSLITLIVIAVLVLLTGGGLVAYRLGRSEQNITSIAPSPTLTSSVALSPSVSPTVLPLPILTPTPTVDETSLIKQAVFAKTGLDGTRAEVTITQNTGQHAKGNIREFEAVGGGYWLAAKADGNWVAVYDGQANPTCAQIAPYDFPTSMVPECLNASGSVVTR